MSEGHPTAPPVPGKPAKPYPDFPLFPHTDTAAIGPNTGHIVGEFGSGSPFVFTGADGDELVCWYGRTDHGASEPGTFQLTIVDILGDGSLGERQEVISRLP